MTKTRASYVCEHALATYAKEIGLNKYIRVGNGQLDNINDTIVADVFESVFLNSISISSSVSFSPTVCSALVGKLKNVFLISAGVGFSLL